ncbi:MAG: phosphotransferase family protein [Woeseiaceae bacterium]|nr:phosphotransferase family protein [Woeseiaceae bacterium]
MLDDARLGAYLEANVDGFGGPVSTRKFSDGQSNPTYLLEANGKKFVLRRKPPGKLLKSAHAVDREFRVISALRDTGVPVPRAVHLCEDDEVVGSMFYIMSFEDGRILWDPSLPDISKPVRKVMHEDLVRVLAKLHDVDVESAGLADFGYPGNYFERQIGRWTKQYRAAETSTIAAMESLIDWLPSNMPEDDGSVSLLHGDYRIDNVVYHKDEPRIIAVLDWELSTLGHPFADLAYLCMVHHLPRGNGVRGLLGVNLDESGIPTEKDIVQHYCERRGIGEIQHWNFYLAFCFFRLASICQGVFKRSLDGNASNKRAELLGKSVEPLASTGVRMFGDA